MVNRHLIVELEEFMAVDPRDNLNPDKRNRLVDAVRDIKIAAAERTDVVIEMKEADRARLEILAQELEPVFADVSADDERFDFALSSGLQPRLWIDATAQVIMGKDRRQYRFVRDTRMGRVVLAESNNTEPVVDAITKYIAERLYERELAFASEDQTFRTGVAQRAAALTVNHSDESALDGASSSSREDEMHAVSAVPAGSDLDADPQVAMAAKDRNSRTAMSSLGWLLIGLFIGAAVLVLFYRDVLFPTIT